LFVLYLFNFIGVQNIQRGSLKCTLRIENLRMMDLTSRLESESEFDDCNIDPDFVLVKQTLKADDLDGILAFETDSGCEQVQQVKDNLEKLMTSIHLLSLF